MSEEPSPLPHPDYRFLLANERTFLAWIRTALGLIAGGVAVEQFAKLAVSWLAEAVGLLSIGIGAGVALFALVHFRRADRAIHADEPLPMQPAVPAVVLGVVTVAFLLLVGIVLL